MKKQDYLYTLVRVSNSYKKVDILNVNELATIRYEDEIKKKYSKPTSRGILRR